MNKKISLKAGLLLVLMALFAFAHTGCTKEDDPPAISASARTLTFDWDGLDAYGNSMQPVTVLTDASWIATSDKSWCAVSKSNGNGTQQISVMIRGELYDGATERSAVITLRTTGRNSVHTTIVVTQTGDPAAIWN